MAPFLSKPGRLVPILAAANQSRHSGGSYKLGWEAWSQQMQDCLHGLAQRCLCQPLSRGPGEIGVASRPTSSIGDLSGKECLVPP